jgi:trypsin
MDISTTPNTTAPRRAHRRRRALTTAVISGLVASGGAVALSSGHAAAIVEGEPTAISETPWQVSLQDSEGQFCGGSIIDLQTILTAAHCIEGGDADDIHVRAGVANWSDETGHDRDVSRIISHPDGFDGAADVALLVLSEPLELSQLVQPIELATAADIASATRGVVSGWGDHGEDGPTGTPDLLSASVPLVADAACASQLGGDEIVADRELCAEGEGAGSCYGDSGGPLAVIGRDGTAKLAGVVSWGIECGVGPGVFAEVPAFADWIEAGIAAGATGQDHPTGEGVDQPDPDAPDDNWDDESEGDWADWDNESDDNWNSWDDDESDDNWDDWNSWDSESDDNWNSWDDDESDDNWDDWNSWDDDESDDNWNSWDDDESDDNWDDWNTGQGCSDDWG